MVTPFNFMIWLTLLAVLISVGFQIGLYLYQKYKDWKKEPTNKTAEKTMKIIYFSSTVSALLILSISLVGKYMNWWR